VQTPAQLDGVKAKKALPPKEEVDEVEEVEEEVIVSEPVKRTSKKPPNQLQKKTSLMCLTSGLLTMSNRTWTPWVCIPNR
jgi:hypothetical protein